MGRCVVLCGLAIVWHHNRLHCTTCTSVSAVPAVSPHLVLLQLACHQLSQVGKHLQRACGMRWESVRKVLLRGTCSTLRPSLPLLPPLLPLPQVARPGPAAFHPLPLPPTPGQPGHPLTCREGPRLDVHHSQAAQHMPFTRHQGGARVAPHVGRPNHKLPLAEAGIFQSVCRAS